jgi:hypothetical protein
MVIPHLESKTFRRTVLLTRRVTFLQSFAYALTQAHMSREENKSATTDKRHISPALSRIHTYLQRRHPLAPYVTGTRVGYLDPYPISSCFARKRDMEMSVENV